MKTRFIFSLIAGLFCLGIVQRALSATPDSVVILQCSVTSGNSYDATAASESRDVRTVVLGNDCARELEIYLMNQFTINKFFGTQDGSIVTYTLIGP